MSREGEETRGGGGGGARFLLECFLVTFLFLKVSKRLSMDGQPAAHDLDQRRLKLA